MLLKTKLILTLLLISTSLTACKLNVNFSGIDGEGPVVERTYPLNKTFTALDISAGWEVELIKSDHPHIVVRTEENLQDLLTYHIKGDELIFKTLKNIGHSKSRKISVYYNNLTAITASSGSEVHSADSFDQAQLNLHSSSGAEIKLQLKTGRLTLDASSGSEIELTGTSKQLSAEASSGADIDLEHLKTQEADVKASSGGSIQVYALNLLKAKTSSGGSIDYKGDPKQKQFNQSISGGSISVDVD